ncbi:MULTISPECIES: response regulator [Methylobacterium]|uniref:Response regulatory domain-containing protein n=2 Tax=Pseudomonadota TaxID=1224 RepID=A0ABQ4SSN0_9HYPH|nr:MULTISPECIES: response regulator [Methylobacterium]PIU06533.1 MAG: hypothetical protein COT56_09490 [Methylobacterium sp. CG09_land_8_20_14_0_10_71_15]PIU11101.1 MAG: hypothetical protein COT28_21700 [Methylobacterium sp. CG08_land_8_20_14_0_20_71_15]GBU16495.1 response regulator [Methylobacterium sp.]GJE06102.1 hypothetical protein AOPFMNJM_1408 [Methylobacterium jeotgali]
MGTANLTGRRILVVEDEYFIADEMRSDFESAGAQVLGPAASVEEALHLLELSPEIDAAVLDINLRGEMAYPVAQALQVRGIPFVFATGYDAQHVPAPFSGVPHCEKPVEPFKVARALFGCPAEGG